MGSRRSSSVKGELKRIVFALVFMALAGWAYVHVILPAQLARTNSLQVPPDTGRGPQVRR